MALQCLCSYLTFSIISNGALHGLAHAYQWHRTLTYSSKLVHKIPISFKELISQTAGDSIIWSKFTAMTVMQQKYMLTNLILTCAMRMAEIKLIFPFGRTWCSLASNLPTSDVNVTSTSLLLRTFQTGQITLNCRIRRVRRRQEKEETEKGKELTLLISRALLKACYSTSLSTDTHTVDFFTL